MAFKRKLFLQGVPGDGKLGNQFFLSELHNSRQIENTKSYMNFVNSSLHKSGLMHRRW